MDDPNSYQRYMNDVATGAERPTPLCEPETNTEIEVRAALAQVKREIASMVGWVGGLTRAGQSEVDWSGNIAKLRADQRELYAMLRDLDPSPF